MKVSVAIMPKHDVHSVVGRQLFGGASLSSPGWFDRSDQQRRVTHGVESSRGWVILLVTPASSCQHTQSDRQGTDSLFFCLLLLRLIVVCAAWHLRLLHTDAHGQITHAHVHIRIGADSLTDKDQ